MCFYLRKNIYMFIDDTLIGVFMCVYEVDAVIPILQIGKPR